MSVISALGVIIHHLAVKEPLHVRLDGGTGVEEPEITAA
jgi:hypothetical protein